MSCLNPLWIVNPKYKKLCGLNDKQKRPGANVCSLSGFPDWVEFKNEFGVDDFMISVPCGRCVNCRTRVANEWKCRLLHEIDYHIRKNKKMYFITFTISPQYYEKAKSDHYYFIRQWLEKYRYKTGESLRHWFTTELGEKTGRLHYHGIVFDPKMTSDELLDMWYASEPQCRFAGYVLDKTASYIVKYMLKPCEWELHEDWHWYNPRRYVSRGLGKCYCTDPLNVAEHNATCGQGVGKWYCQFDGYKLPVPRYYHDKLFTKETIYENKRRYYENPPTEWSVRTASTCHVFNDFNRYLVVRREVWLDTLKRNMSLPELDYYSKQSTYDPYTENLEFAVKQKQTLFIKNLTLWDC